ncbi:MAG: 4-phosphoerythronate dehydrogenase [Chromatiales bacterium]
MRILADENITQVAAAFASLGDVALVPGRQITRAALSVANMLLVRSVTRVDAALLTGTPVRFVASATSGVDHVDLNYLRTRGIGFAHAPGSNAESVAEYVLSAVLALLARRDREPRGLSAGIIGCGEVGSRVAAKLEVVGMHCLRNDPPLRGRTGDVCYIDLQRALGADIVTLHVPLTHTGRHATRGMIGHRELAQLKTGAILINTARGPVVDEAALRQTLIRGSDLQVVIDCWEDEPQVDIDLLSHAAIATPHVAGYSYDGKLRATHMIYEAACAFAGQAAAWQPAPPGFTPAPLTMQADETEMGAIRRAVFSGYDVRDDDAALRQLPALPQAERGAYFDRLRRDYRVRREFSAITVIADGRAQTCAATLGALGFHVPALASRGAITAQAGAEAGMA